MESPTGSGKTTQIPLILHEAGYTSKGMVGVTQPRRIAAVSVSEFIARQIHTTIPNIVGYTMRFEDKTDDETVIKVMTDGILLQELKSDRLLSRYSVLMVDEAHERSLNIDFILGMLKGILAARPEFRVIVSSATINVEVFSEYFDGCPVVSIDAPMFPVEVKYTPPEIEGDPESLMLRIGDIVRAIMQKKEQGRHPHLPSRARWPSRTACRCSPTWTGTKELVLLPLYGRLSHEDQGQGLPRLPGEAKGDRVHEHRRDEHHDRRRRVRHRFGAGEGELLQPEDLHGVPHRGSGLPRLVQPAPWPRRDGRRPGVCYRLYTKKDLDGRPMYTMEEILRTDLSEVVLRMAELGIREFESFDFLSPPGQDGIRAAVETLQLLDALDEERALTETGRMMCMFPILPEARAHDRGGHPRPTPPSSRKSSWPPRFSR